MATRNIAGTLMDTNKFAYTWFVLDLNPEPWAIGPVVVGRKNGKMYGNIGRNTQLWNYQQAVKEALGNPDVFFEGRIELAFFFWRRRDEYKTHQARTHRKHEADVSNMVKATEDALQGVLFKNDKDTKVIHAHEVAQGPDVIPKIVIGIRSAEPSLDYFPDFIQVRLDEIDAAWGGGDIDNEWNG